MRGAAAMRVLLLVAVTLAYDFNDPDAPHTSMAIRFDGEGRRADSRRSSRPRPDYAHDLDPRQPGRVLHAHGERSAHRARKVELYGLSRTPSERRQLVQDDEDQRLYGENWGHLMTNFEIEHVLLTKTVLDADPQMCGAPSNDDSWLKRNDGSDRDGLLLHRVPVEPGIELPESMNDLRIQQFLEGDRLFY